MLRNNVINAISFFYPIGNTPAVCLTQDLPPEQSADVLLIGCGDARNILFTTYAGSGRPQLFWCEIAFLRSLAGRHLDLTCCDIEPAILARNILLFTLLIDDSYDAASDKIWDIYYHIYLNESSLHLLDTQAEKLLSLSATLKDWNASQYGRNLRFCDQRTFSKVKELWTGYSRTHLNPQERERRHSQYQNTIEKAKAARKKFLGKGIHLTGVRSAAPIGIQALKDLPEITRYYWEHGTVDQGVDSNQDSDFPNPTFAFSPNPALMLHYALDPILGFHLATAYAPLTSNSPLCPKLQHSTSTRVVVEAAKSQFREWSGSFRRCITDGSIIRVFAGDAITFCHTIRQVRVQGCDASLYYDNWTFQPLKLDGGDHESSTPLAPLSFDIIDTSNLVDHLGALNVLVAAIPLLIDKATSTLYTEVLVQNESSARGMIDNILCGHFATVSLLLGIASVESWTNATAVASVDEGILDALSASTNTKSEPGSGQLRTRLSWKSLSALSQLDSVHKNSTTSVPTNIEIDAQGLSRLLYSLYQAMFCHEDIRTLMKSVQSQGLKKLSNPYYNRASFGAILKHIKSKVVVDWEEAINAFLALLERDTSALSVGRNYMQELYLHLHLCGVYTVQTLKGEDAATGFNLVAAKNISSWKHVPPVLCITFEIPRGQLKRLTGMPIGALGTPSLCCTVQSSRGSSRQWGNNFAAVQYTCGCVNLIGSKSDASFRVEVTEDSDGWAGKSPLVVSFYLPTWVISQEPATALVACGFQSTPHAAMTFMQVLGPELRIFETTLGDERKVHITRYMPHVSAYPVSNACSTKPDNTGPRAGINFYQTVSANVGADGHQIVSLSCKIDFVSVDVKTKLADRGSAVHLSFSCPIMGEVVVGKTVRCRMIFPVPVSGSRSKLRIARKSSYVEIIAPVFGPLDTDGCPSFLFPLSIVHGNDTQWEALPANWNMPYVNLDVLPTLDTKQPRQLQWLITHVSMMFSNRERTIREAGMLKLSQSLSRDVRVDFKDGLFSLFMHFTGLQGGQAKVFALHKESAGGVHVLLFVSSLKLDLASHTVILDTAALPLTDEITKDGKMQTFLGVLQSAGNMCAINVTDAELRLWKQIMPALAERCRTWKHKPGSCVYLSAGQVPYENGLQDANTPLCSCGNGQIPPKFISKLKVPHLEYVLQKYATRIAISPIFAVPYIEDCFLTDMVGSPSGIGNFRPPLTATNQRCRVCGSDKKKTTNGSSEALLMCTRCKLARYCSKECQRADWKEHKAVCVAH